MKLIRYAEEGFINYSQEHLRSPEGVIHGCYAFIEKMDEALLTYKAAYAETHPGVKNRKGEPRHELIIPEDTPVYVMNKHLPVSHECIWISSDKEQVIIPEEPIQKIKIIGNGMEPPYP